jgi:hypothetical protein
MITNTKCILKYMQRTIKYSIIKGKAIPVTGRGGP